jgi:hypothetical protein
MGPGTYTGDLRFVERADSINNQHAAQIDVWAAPANTPTQMWSCNPEKLDDGRVIATDCRQAVVLPEGASTSANVLVRPGEGWQKDNRLTNCATLPFEEGTIETLKSCATVKLDPFGVQVVKIGDESCEPGGECRFEIEIFNPGPIVHDDPVTVVDNLSGLGSAPILSIMPAAGAKAFPCAQPPTQVPFRCTGSMRLDVGERHKYVMTLRLPPSAPGGTSFRNCASVGSPESAAASRGPVNQVSAQAGPTGPKGSGLAPSGCHEVRIPLQCPRGLERRSSNLLPAVAVLPKRSLRRPTVDARAAAGVASAAANAPTASVLCAISGQGMSGRYAGHMAKVLSAATSADLPDAWHAGQMAEVLSGSTTKLWSGPDTTKVSTGTGITKLSTGTGITKLSTGTGITKLSTGTGITKLSTGTGTTNQSASTTTGSAELQGPRLGGPVAELL